MLEIVKSKNACFLVFPFVFFQIHDDTIIVLSAKNESSNLF